VNEVSNNNFPYGSITECQNITAEIQAVKLITLANCNYSVLTVIFYNC